MTKLEKVVEYLEDLSDDALIGLYNEYEREHGSYDNEFLNWDELEECFQDKDWQWMLDRFYYGSDKEHPINPNCDYIAIDGYGNFECLWEYQAVERIDKKELAENLINNHEYVYLDDELEEIINEDDEEDK